MRQGISTRYLGPTNSRGSRIKAIARKRDSWGPEQALTDPLDHGAGTERNHTRVAHLLATKLGWRGVWVGAGNPEGTGFHYVQVFAGCPNERSHYPLSSLGVEGEDWFLVPWAASAS